MREGKGSMRTWNRMKQLMMNHFLPAYYEQMLYVQYQQCQQKGKSVHDYTDEFYRLSARNNLNETDVQLVAWYVSGLKETIREKTSSRTYFNRKPSGNVSSEKDKSSSSTSTSSPKQGSKGVIESSNKNQGKLHSVQTRNNPYARPTPGKCFRCNLLGHRSNECPLRKQINVLNDHEEEDEEYGEAEDGFEDDMNEIYGDDGKSKSNSQRNTIFRTRCTIDDRVCDVIIDNDSSDNVVSKALVKALDLKTEKHPKPS
ncbi:hypothetical protein Dsin_003591 [Dipteronia sinensis]|uniref:CCHC-type domain-containing protein n=1 Tax=Dipteronia sinensis TaxID=43782 RepID=A0AAE0B9E2_9ROSI|nr:hypothetical protein Dsin_003591 [Dipteronia sinensis]